LNKVILVEDEVYARQGLRNLLDWERCGFRVCGEAGNGEEALGLIAETEPDLIITDIRMPVLDGLELIRTVRAGGNRDAKFIIISGYGDFKYAQQAIKFGVKDFILKPVDEEELTDALMQLAAEIENDRLAKEAPPGYANSALERLLLGRAGEDEAAAMAKLLGLERDAPYAFVIAEVNGLGAAPEGASPAGAASPAAPATAPETPSAPPAPFASASLSAAKPPPASSAASSARLPAPPSASPSGTPAPPRMPAPPLAAERLRAEIAAAARELGLADHPVHPFPVRPGAWGFPAGVKPHGDAERLEAAAERFALRLRKRLGLPVLVYVGETAPRLDALKAAYLTACEAIPYKYAFADRSVLSYRLLKDEELRYAEFEPGEYARLLERLEDGDASERRAGVDLIFDHIRRNRYAPEAVQNAVARFVFGVIGGIRSLQGDENELRSLEAVLQWQERPITLAGLKERFLAFVEESAELAARLRRSSAKGDIVKIKSFIESHYNEDISLKSIAARFYMNPVYLGQLFKKTYGIYFNDYLLQIRIDHAKRLLRQTEMRVYEIARSVGFDNADYFVCKFEKVEGKSPTAYRNERLAKT